MIDGNGTVISINPAVVNMFGYQPAISWDENIKMLMPEPNAAATTAIWRFYESTGRRGRSAWAGIGV